MITVSFDSSKLFKDLENAIQYHAGFVDGAVLAKPIMMENISHIVKDMLYEFIDSMARVDPARLHHVYEWSQTGMSNARLYDLECVPNKNGIRISYEFSQSMSVKNGSTVPFHNKASIMENGAPVTIRPVRAKALAFEQDGKQVFSKGPIVVNNPGGDLVDGGFESTIKSFFNNYVSQSLLSASGIEWQIHDLSDFKNNLKNSKSGGYKLGVQTGKKWISKVGTIE